MRARLKPDPTDDEPHDDTINPSHLATSSNGARVRLKDNTDCKTMHVVYLISCGECGKQCVGETKGQLSVRMNVHRDGWRQRRFERSPVAEHFCLPGHDFLSHAFVSSPEPKAHKVSL